MYLDLIYFFIFLVGILVDGVPWYIGTTGISDVRSLLESDLNLCYLAGLVLFCLGCLLMLCAGTSTGTEFLVWFLLYCLVWFLCWLLI
jgi:hypothetical protein